MFKEISDTDQRPVKKKIEKKKKKKNQKKLEKTDYAGGTKLKRKSKEQMYSY